MRERLFMCLDKAREHPVIWITAPPGGGKTTLLATYLEVRRATGGIWYQVDAGDNDAPSFFFHLRLAERALSGAARHPALPLLTPEYLPDICGFARRFVRVLFTRMPVGSLLIFDNFQELTEDNRLHEALAAAFNEIPAHVNVAVLSRSRPSGFYSHRLLDGGIAEIGWDQLRLTLEETQAMIAVHRGTHYVDALHLHRETAGWPAGLTLMIEKLKQGAALPATVSIEALQDIFDYFASQLFDKLQSRERDTLLRLSVLPHFTVKMAVGVSADDTAERLLEHLYRRNLFIDARRNHLGEYVYQFHALFRTFLLHRANTLVGADLLAQLSKKAARALEQADQRDDAVDLYIAAADWEPAIAITTADAALLVAQGRSQVVLERINACPRALIEDRPWLLYWLGLAQMAADPVSARWALLSSHVRATEHGDNHCVLQAAAAMVQTYLLEYGRLQPLDEWLPVLEKAFHSANSFPSVDAELAVMAALLVVISYRQPAHPDRVRCLDRIYELTMAPGDANLRIMATGYVLAHACTTGHLSDGLRVIAIARDLMKRSEITAMNRGWWLAVSTWYYTLSVDYTAARNAISEIARIGAENNLPGVSRFAITMGVWTEIFAGNLQLAQSMVTEAPSPTNATYDVATIAGAAGVIATLNGTPQAGIDQGLLAVRLFDEMGSRMHRVNFRMACSWTHIKLGKLETAQKLIDEARAIESDRPHYWQQPILWALEAQIHAAQGNEGERKSAVSTALRSAREGDYWYGFGHPFDLRDICCYVLAHRIEIEYTRHIIRRLGWRGASQLLEGWPWLVRIHTLGEFTVLHNDRPLQWGRKAPHRLLAVLKALVAFGGREVSARRLADTLWPDVEGDRAMESLAVSLRRLRALLGGDVVGEVDGKVGFDAGQVWIDVWAFEQGLLHQLSDSAGRRCSLELYHGPFLAEETDARWAVPTRERLRAKFVEHVASDALSLEAAADVESAMQLYRRGIEADDLTESFYQGLMRCQLRMGQRAEALSTYRRLRQILSVVLGASPSEESERLIRATGTVEEVKNRQVQSEAKNREGQS